MSRLHIAFVLALVLVVLPAGCGFFDDPHQPSGHECWTGKCTIAGYVHDFQGKPMKDIKIYRSGEGGGYVVTDKYGHYVMGSNIPGWRYCVAPGDSEWTFEPDRRCYYIDENLENQNFTAYPAEVYWRSISGRIEDSAGNPIPDVVVTLEGMEKDPVVTDEKGDYIVSGLYAGFRYCVTPSKEGCTFTPEERCIENLDVSYPYQNFTASCP